MKRIYWLYRGAGFILFFIGGINSIQHGKGSARSQAEPGRALLSKVISLLFL